MAGNPTFLRQFATLLLLILLGATSWLAWNRYQTTSPPPGEGAAPAPEAATARVYYGPANSLAMLPFSDRSPAQDQLPQAYAFAADLLDRFVEEPALQVAARSSAFFFRDGTGSPQVVAERLQHAHLLRGDWHSEGDSVYLTVSLFDARIDRETWRRDYRQPLTGLAALRDRIVADVLAELSVAAAVERPPAQAVEPAVWMDYAQGLYAADSLGSQDLGRAAAALLAAIDREPDFVAARLALAELWLHPGWSGQDAGAAVDAARQAIVQVLDHHPASARALGLLSHIRHQYDWDWHGAEAAGRSAVAAEPGNAIALSVASLAASTLGHFDQAQAWLEESIRRDPLNLGSRLRMGLLQEFQQDFDGALASYRRILVLNPEYPAAHAYRARVKALQGKATSALRESEHEADFFWRRYARILALLAEGSDTDAWSLLETMIAEAGDIAAFQIAEIFAFGGDTEQAFGWLQRARERRDPGLAALLGNPLLQNLHGDPRWAALLASLGLAIDSPG